MGYHEVAVVIPFLNAEATIDQCAYSLLNQTYPAEKTSFLFVDNGSTDQSVKRLKNIISKKKNAHIIFCPKPGSYTARNSGLKYVDSEIVAFTDSDCVVHSNWIEALVRNYSSKKIGGVGGKLLPLWKRDQPDFYATYHWLVGVYEQSLRYAAGYLQTANVSYRKDVLDEMCGYDETLQSGGDADLSWRVTDKGYKILYEPGAVVYHHPRRSVQALIKLFIRYGKGTAELEGIHPNRKMMSDPNLFRTQFSRFWKMFIYPTFRAYRKYIIPAVGLEAIRALAFLLGYTSGKLTSKKQMSPPKKS